GLPPLFSARAGDRSTRRPLRRPAQSRQGQRPAGHGTRGALRYRLDPAGVLLPRQPPAARALRGLHGREGTGQGNPARPRHLIDRPQPRPGCSIPALVERRNVMASSNVMTFTNDNWQQEVVQSDIPVVVDFWAPWCGPCRMMSPTIDKLAEQVAGKVKIGKLKFEENQELAMLYAIPAIL